jgi:hypothetical protein
LGSQKYSFWVTTGGIQLLSDHLEAARMFPQPSDKQGLQRSLGVVNFYRRFLPKAAATLRPLTDALQGPRGKRKQLLWSGDMEQAFQAIKKQLCEAATLVHPDPGARVSLAVDASDSHVGAVLQQFEGREWRSLAFYSKKLDATQRRDSATTLSPLAMCCISAMLLPSSPGV